MRVLSVGSMYPPHHLGGYELMWRSAVREMREGGDEVRVLTSDLRLPGAGRTEGDEAGVHRELRWYWRDHEFPRLGIGERVALERHNARVLDTHLHELRPDAVNWWAMGGMSLSLVERARRAGIPAAGAIVDEWMVYGPKVDGWQRATGRLGAPGSLASRLAGAPAPVDLDAAAHWVFVSESLRRHARDAGLKLPRSSVAHAGIDAELFREAPEPPWRWRLLCLGRLDPRKGIHVAVGALTELADARLDVVGKGDERYGAELRRLADELGVAERVRFSEPSRARLPELYAEADALLFPVLWEEPWGLVPLEAMAVGTPVIATGAGGSDEYLEDGVNCAIYAPREDPAALAAAVRGLAGDPPLRAKLRAGGLATADRFPESGFNAAVREALAAVADSPR